MGTNPYLSGDEDDDILNPKTSEGAGSSNGRKKFRVNGVDGEALPPELQNAISEYIDTEVAEITSISTGTGLPVEFRSIAWLFDYFSDYSKTVTSGPVLLAVAEVLDDITDGRVSLLTRLFEAERRVMWTQAIRRTLNLFLTYNIVSESNPYAGEIRMYMETYADIVNFTYENAVNSYRALSAKAGKDVDEQFIESGVLSERSALKRVAMGQPYAKRDTD